MRTPFHRDPNYSKLPVNLLDSLSPSASPHSLHSLVMWYQYSEILQYIEWSKPKYTLYHHPCRSLLILSTLTTSSSLNIYSRPLLLTVILFFELLLKERKRVFVLVDKFDWESCFGTVLIWIQTGIQEIMCLKLTESWINWTVRLAKQDFLIFENSVNSHTIRLL